MYRSRFGRVGQVECATPQDYYELIGYLAKSDGTTALVWEHNEEQGAWGSEGRIHFYEKSVPLASHLKFTKGNGSIAHRVNCNAFVEHIVRHHKFVSGSVQNIACIRSTIPPRYIPDFERGLSL